MNKTEFAAAVAEKTGFTKVDAKQAVDAFVDVITETLKKGEEVRLLGFGTFSVSERAARMATDPRNPGKKIKVAAHKVVKFKPGAALNLRKK